MKAFYIFLEYVLLLEKLLVFLFYTKRLQNVFTEVRE